MCEAHESSFWVKSGRTSSRSVRDESDVNTVSCHCSGSWYERDGSGHSDIHLRKQSATWRRKYTVSKPANRNDVYWCYESVKHSSSIYLHSDLGDRRHRAGFPASSRGKYCGHNRECYILCTRPYLFRLYFQPAGRWPYGYWRPG